MIVTNNLPQAVHKSNSPTDYDSFLRWVWAGNIPGLSAILLRTAIVFGIRVMLWTGVNKMTPEEVHRELAEIKGMLLEIKAAFDRFTAERKQYWKDESATAGGDLG